MKNYLNPSLKSLTIVLAVILLFLSCKKQQLTSTELGNMAEAKLTEIKTLAADIPCNQLSNVTIQDLSTSCSASFYPIKSSDLSKFNSLKKEYFDLLNQQTSAMVKEGYVIDPCFETIWVRDQPIRLECNADKVQLITTMNINIEEAKPLAVKTYEEVMVIVKAQTCTNETAWVPTVLIKDKIMEFEYIPYSRTQDYSELKKKVSLYNRLKYRILLAQNPADYVVPTVKVDKVECVNGKPVIKFKD